jgi:hypothetical protein
MWGMFDKRQKSSPSWSRYQPAIVSWAQLVDVVAGQYADRNFLASISDAEPLAGRVVSFLMRCDLSVDEAIGVLGLRDDFSDNFDAVVGIVERAMRLPKALEHQDERLGVVLDYKPTAHRTESVELLLLLLLLPNMDGDQEALAGIERMRKGLTFGSIYNLHTITGFGVAALVDLAGS